MADDVVAGLYANVLLQLDNLRSYACVADGERNGTLTIHGWLYDLHTGTIRAFNPETGDWESIASHSGEEG
mgnify:CR=1 FL=1